MTLRFLLLEDNPLDAEVVQITLLNGGMDCDLAVVDTRATFEAALETETFDLILADYALPGFDGLTALKIAHKQYPAIPFIFVSASLGEELAIESLKQGATDYVLKQRLERLVPCVKRALQETQEHRDRKAAEAALQESETRFKRFAENHKDVIWIADTQAHQLIFVNSAYDRVWGRPASELCRDLDCFLKFIHPEDRDRIQLGWQRCQNEALSQEYRVLRPDGTIVWIRDRCFPIYSDQGELLWVGGIAEDISDRKQAEAERCQLLERERAAREEAERANHMKDEFLAILSHELRTPLNPILGWSKMLQSTQFDPETTQLALSTIERNVKLQTQLIDDLLDVARILRGKLTLDLTSVNLASVIEAAVDIVRTTAETKSISLQLELEEVAPVRGDTVRLQQTVWNLLTNAIKFTPKGGQVTVKLEPIRGEGNKHENAGKQKEHCPSGYAQITVTDTGHGINPDFLPYIFQSFRQADASTARQHGGLGLGLSIVKHLVDAHDGTITAHNAGERQGAVFTLQLPVQAQASVARITPSQSTSTNLDLTGTKVLAVDDMEDTRQLLIMLLTQYGAEVNAVASGKEALAALEAFNPDVMICDLGMPTMDGYELIRQLRALPTERGGEIPAIAVTAYVRDEDRQRALAYGFQQHIAKPLEPKELVSAIAKLTTK